MRSAKRFVIQALASCFFLTYPLVHLAKKRKWRWTGAGFIGSLAGLGCARWLPTQPIRCAVVLIGAFFISVAVSDAAEEILQNKDDQRIVIDEWVGYLASIAFLPKTSVILITGFVFFRISDTLKLAGVNKLARLPGGWGIVMDDVAGGILVNAILHLLPLS